MNRSLTTGVGPFTRPSDSLSPKQKEPFSTRRPAWAHRGRAPATGLLLFLLVSAAGCRKLGDPSPTLTVAAAADLTDALTPLCREFERTHRIRVVTSFGSTGLLTRQIEEGGPFDVFLAANEAMVRRLKTEGHVLEGSERVYARGRIVLWQRSDATLKVGSLRDLTQPAVRRIAIANPEHAPYGLAAKQALECQGIWEVVRPKLVFGENISQTLQFAQTGNVDAAIVARSISLRPGGQAVLIESRLHQPISQALCILRRSPNPGLAREFVAFLSGPTGQSVLKDFGFELAEGQ